MGFKSGPGGDLGGTEITTSETGSFGAVNVKETIAVTAPADGAGGVLYSKADGKLYWVSNEISEVDISAASATLTQEQVEDFAGALVASGGTKTGITVTYQDGTGDMDFTVADTTVAGDSGTTAMTPGDTLTIAGGTNVSTAMSGDTLTITATDTNTQLSQEQVEDFAGAVVASGGTKTGITVTYQDGTGDMDFVVADTTVAGDSGTTAMTPGDTLTIAGGTNVPTAMSGDTLTINASGGSSKQTWSLSIAGRMKIQTTSTDRMYVHGNEMGSSNYADWSNLRTEVADVTADSFTTTLDQAYFYYASAIAPFACTAKNFIIALSIKDSTSFDYTAGNDPNFKLWRGRHDNETEDATVTWTRLKDGIQFDTTETEPTVSRKTITSFDETAFAAGDLLCLSFYTGGASISNNNQFIAHFTAIED